MRCNGLQEGSVNRLAVLSQPLPAAIQRRSRTRSNGVSRCGWGMYRPGSLSSPQ